jgi:hypothetical protein
MLNPFGVERPPGEGSELRTIVPTAPQHTLQEWDLSTDVQPEHHPAPEAMPLSEPTVLKPVRSGDDTQSVDLPALDHLAEVVGALETPLRNALDSLGNVDVRPGGFYHANQIRAKVTGQDGDAGLVQSYITTLTNLIEGVMDIRDGLRKLREEYAKAERDAVISAADVQQVMQQAEGDFNSVTQVRT